MYSWWWVELSPETCRVKPLRRINAFVAFVGFVSLYYTTVLICLLQFLCWLIFPLILKLTWLGQLCTWSTDVTLLTLVTKFNVQGFLHRKYIPFGIFPTRSILHSLFISGKLLYMFRVVSPPIIRSTHNCIYRIWYLSNRYCYLPLLWKSWKWFSVPNLPPSGR